MDTNKRATNFSGLRLGSVVATAAAVTLDANRDSGKTFLTGVTTAQTFTLPAATGSNSVFTFIVTATATGNKIIQANNATDEFLGILTSIDTDTSDAMATFAALPADNADTITLNGTTTGGVGGDIITITDIAAGVYHLQGTTMASGVPSTPLSAAV